MKLVIRGGRVIDPSRDIDREADVVLSDGVVDAVVDAGTGSGEETIDASGLIVTPGFIDLHTHLRQPGQEAKETIATGTRAAVAGGFTAVCCMANTDPVNDSPSVTRHIRSLAETEGVARVYPVGAVTRGLQGQRLTDMGSLRMEGCVAVSDDGLPILDSGVMRRALEFAADFGLPVSVHEEDHQLSRHGDMHEGPHSCRLGLRGMPAAAETVMVARDLELAELTGAHLHVAHLSAAGSARLVRDAKQRGLRVTAEVTPHHLLLTDDAVGLYDTNKKMMPPLRSQDDVRAILEAVVDRTIDAVATDHAPHTAGSKNVPFAEAPNGVTGLETALPVVLTLVEAGTIDLARAVELLTSGPASAFDLPGGTLEAGSPADVTVFDPKAEWTVEAGELASKSKNSAFLGWKFRGKVRYTVVAGKVVYRS